MKDFFKNKIVFILCLLLIPNFSHGQDAKSTNGQVETVLIGDQTIALNSSFVYLTPPVSGYTHQDWQNLAKLIQLHTLNIKGEGLKSLANFPILPNLVELKIEETRLEDISPLKNARNLKSLSLRHIKSRTISGWSELTSLQNLTINYTMLDDFSFLTSLYHLNYLNLADSNFSSPRLISANADIAILDLSRTNVRNIRLLEHF